MKNKLLMITVCFLAACAGDSQPSASSSTKSNAKSNPSSRNAMATKAAPASQGAAQFCSKVGGKVKEVKGGQALCMLPGGDVVKLNEFYEDNKK